MKNKKRMLGLGLAAALALGTAACGGKAAPKEAVMEKTEFIPESVGVYEAEEASFSGNVRAGAAKKGYTGSGYAEGFERDADACAFTVEVSADGAAFGDSVLRRTYMRAAPTGCLSQNIRGGFIWITWRF